MFNVAYKEFSALLHADCLLNGVVRNIRTYHVDNLN